MNIEKAKNIELEWIRETLGNPVFIGLSDYALKLLRNLVALSATIIFYKFSGVQIVSIFGFCFTNVDLYKIDIALGIYLTYSASHFFFEAWETYLRWTIRLSGAFTEVQKPPQALGNLRTSMLLKDDGTNKEAFARDCTKLEYIKNISYEQSYLYNVVLQLLIYNKANLCSNEKKTEEVVLKIVSMLVQESLERCFIKKFKQFQLTQVIKFFTFDILIPILLTLTALYYLSKALL